MATFFFPDTTVLVNFEVLDRWDVLDRLVGGKARWVSAVEDECLDWSATHPNIHAAAVAVFGPPERPTGNELQDVRVTRDDMGAPYDPPRRHLGEAETIVILESRHAGSYFMTDDGGAARFATARGITCIGTLNLLDAATKGKLITPGERIQDEASLKAEGRYPRSFP